MTYAARPTATYLQRLVQALVGNEKIPLPIRNECHKLMLAIDRNDWPLISESVARIQKLAVEANVSLPPSLDLHSEREGR